MSESSNKSLVSSFWLSIILHLLIFFLIITTFVFQPNVVQQKPPSLYVPSYVYTGAVPPQTVSNQQAQSAKSTVRKQHTAQEKKASSPFPETAVSGKMYQASKKPSMKESVLASSLKMLQQDQVQFMQAKKEEDPIYLIGDMSQAADPLIKLIGRALSRNFHYPDTAGRLGIKGRALIGLTLHPEGYFSDVELMKSSNSPDLDAAALYAVNQAPTVEGADRFINEPKHFVIGFIFY